MKMKLTQMDSEGVKHALLEKIYKIHGIVHAMTFHNRSTTYIKSSSIQSLVRGRYKLVTTGSNPDGGGKFGLTMIIVVIV